MPSAGSQVITTNSHITGIEVKIAKLTKHGSKKKKKKKKHEININL